MMAVQVRNFIEHPPMMGGSLGRCPHPSRKEKARIVKVAPAFWACRIAALIRGCNVPSTIAAKSSANMPKRPDAITPGSAGYYKEET
jgi:hypothetical protein